MRKYNKSGIKLYEERNKTSKEEAITIAKVKVNQSSDSYKPRRPALTPEARVNQLISDAYDLAEKQIRSGEASSQVITHFLKLGSDQEKNKLEIEKLREENKLLIAKTEQLQSQKRMDELYLEAIEAMKSYSGHGDSDDY